MISMHSFRALEMPAPAGCFYKSSARMVATQARMGVEFSSATGCGSSTPKPGHLRTPPGSPSGPRKHFNHMRRSHFIGHQPTDLELSLCGSKHKFSMHLF